MRRTSRTEQAQRIEDRLVRFGQRTVALAGDLPHDHLARPIRRHLEHGCVAPGQCYAAARRAHHPDRRRHLMGRCLKGLRESRIWLELIAELQLIPRTRLQPIFNELDGLVRDVAASQEGSSRAVTI